MPRSFFPAPHTARDRRRARVAGALAACGAMVAALALVPGTAQADTTVQVSRNFKIHTGAVQPVLGPMGTVDSLYATFKDPQGKLHAFMSNDTVTIYHQSASGEMTNPRVVLSDGGKGSKDQCGVHPVGTIYKATKTHWIGFYHGEQANPKQNNGNCNGTIKGTRNYTRWAIFRMQTFDGGKTWHKDTTRAKKTDKLKYLPGLVISQSDALRKWPTQWPTTAEQVAHGTYPDTHSDDAGSPRLVIYRGYMYLYYRAANDDSDGQLQMSVARSKLSSLGAPGTWYKYYTPTTTKTVCSKSGEPPNPTLGCFGNGTRETVNVPGKPGWRTPGIGGDQTAIDPPPEDHPSLGLPASARGITWNNARNMWLTVTTDQTGIYLYATLGRDSIQTPWKQNWHRLGRIAGPPQGSAGQAFGRPCKDGHIAVSNGSGGLKPGPKLFPAVEAYGATIGWDGSSEVTGKKFWVYYMLKPLGYCFDHRILVRRAVVFNAPAPAIKNYPKITSTSGSERSRST